MSNLTRLQMRRLCHSGLLTTAMVAACVVERASAQVYSFSGTSPIPANAVQQVPQWPPAAPQIPQRQVQAARILRVRPGRVQIDVKVATLRGNHAKGSGPTQAGSQPPFFPKTPMGKNSSRGVAGNRQATSSIDQVTVLPQTINMILTDSQFRLVLQAIERRDDAHIQSSWAETTQAGQAAQWEIAADDNTKPTQIVLNGWPVSLTPKLNITPSIGADGQTIHLETALTLMEFDTAPEAGDPDAAQSPAPRWHSVKHPKAIDMREGQTVALSQTRRNTGGSPLEDQLIFITPVLVDPAGNRLNPQNRLDNHPPEDNLPR